MNNLDVEIKLLNASGLAKALGVPPNYITRMKQAGFPMPDGRATVKEALCWRGNNPKYHAFTAHLRDVSDQPDEACGK